MTVHGATAADVSFETDRMRFIGRGRTLRRPAGDARRRTAVRTARARCSIRSPRSGAQSSLDAGRDGDDRYDHRRRRDARGVPRAGRRSTTIARSPIASLDAARWTHSHVLLRQINASEADAQRLCAPGQLRSSTPMLRCAPTRAFSAGIAAGSRVCGRYAISGDLPIVLLRIADAANIDLARQLRAGARVLAAARTGRRPGDLERRSRRRSPALQEQIIGTLIAAARDADGVDQPGGIFVRVASTRCPDEDRRSATSGRAASS